jgi:hypothetical protein
LGEGHFSLILANKAIIGRIFHRNRKEGIIGVLRYWQRQRERKRRPIWAYFPLWSESPLGKPTWRGAIAPLSIRFDKKSLKVFIPDRPLFFNNPFFLDTHHRYSMKKYRPAIIQTINNPHMIEEVSPLTSKIPTLNRTAPIVRTRSFFTATALHLISPLYA